MASIGRHRELRRFLVAACSYIQSLLLSDLELPSESESDPDPDPESESLAEELLDSGLDPLSEEEDAESELEPSLESLSEDEEEAADEDDDSDSDEDGACFRRFFRSCFRISASIDLRSAWRLSTPPGTSGGWSSGSWNLERKTKTILVVHLGKKPRTSLKIHKCVA